MGNKRLQEVLNKRATGSDGHQDQAMLLPQEGASPLSRGDPLPLPLPPISLPETAASPAPDLAKPHHRPLRPSSRTAGLSHPWSPERLQDPGLEQQEATSRTEGQCLRLHPEAPAGPVGPMFVRCRDRLATPGPRPESLPSTHYPVTMSVAAISGPRFSLLGRR